MSLAGLGATVTVTVNVAVVPSAAVTVYATGAVKLLAVTLLTCAVPPTVTLSPVVANVATSAVTLVPNGTVAAIAVPLIVAVTSAPSPALFADRNEYAVIAFEELSPTVTVTVK